MSQFQKPSGEIAPSGAIFVVGSASGVAGIDASHRIVRRSTDGDSTWQTVDDLAPTPGASSYGADIAIASDGTAYTIGHAPALAGSASWVARKSDTDGENWTTVLDYQPSPGRLAVPRGLAVLPDGSVVVSGTAADAADVGHWIVQRSQPGGTRFSVVDDLVAGMPGAGAWTASFGSRIHVAGGVTDVAGQHWVVRVYWFGVNETGGLG